MPSLVLPHGGITAHLQTAFPIFRQLIIFRNIRHIEYSYKEMFHFYTSGTCEVLCIKHVRMLHKEKWE